MFIQVDIDKEDLIQNFRENVFDEDIKDFILALDQELENEDFTISLIVDLFKSLKLDKSVMDNFNLLLYNAGLTDYIDDKGNVPNMEID